MQIMITHGALARTRVLQFSRWQVGGTAAALALLLVLGSGAVYHWFFLKAAREGWPVVSTLVRWVVRDEIAQRDRFLRENLDAMAQKVGEMQARLIRLEAVGERVTGLAGVKSEELEPLRRGLAPGAPGTPLQKSPSGRPLAPGSGDAERSSPGRSMSVPSATSGPPAGRGGAQAPGRPASSVTAGGQGGVYLPLDRPGFDDLERVLGLLGARADETADLFVLAESRLFEARMQALTVPSVAPVDGPVGSGFGFRPDPFAGRTALHTGLDFPAEVGTPVRAAAGGVVQAVGWHPQYGQVLEIDHGNGLSTLYAHLSKVQAQTGSIVRRGQVVAQVGNTGRSTGPHLHFEVLLGGVPQDPARFLAARPASPTARSARGGPMVK
jgi:murein DD-endopeptidase MepM/ murein hydrolase activator NlpD